MKITKKKYKAPSRIEINTLDRLFSQVDRHDQAIITWNNSYYEIKKIKHANDK